MTPETILAALVAALIVGLAITYRWHRSHKKQWSTFRLREREIPKHLEKWRPGL